MSWWPISGRWRVPSLVTAALLVLLALALGALAAYSGYSANTTTVPGGPTGHRHPRATRTAHGAGAHGRRSGGQATGGTTPSTTSSTTSTAAPAGTTTAEGTWTVYGGAPGGEGLSATPVRLGSPHHAWTSPALDGQIYGQPLEVGGRVVAATENDTVYALAAATGHVLWSTHVGDPVPAGSLPCGDISPTVGITGTPVIDSARDEAFVVADEQSATGLSHHLVGLDLATGAVRLDVAVDPPGAQPADLLQRTGLTLDQGEVVFGYGGNEGDCGTYHGWVTAVPETGGTIHRFEVDAPAGDLQGAVWMGGAAPVVDAAGNVWVATGNGSVRTGPHAGGDAVDELTSGLHLEQSFAPSTWRADNAGDKDLGSTAPALLANGTVLQVGKSETGYLLSARHLGGVGGQLTTGHVCTAIAAGGDAVNGSVVYVGCESGVQAVQTGTSPPTVSVRWTATGAATGPPIVAGGLVWSIGGGTLYGLAPQSGATKVRLDLGSEADHFSTPAVADGLLLASGGTNGDEVLAFSGSAGVPPPSGHTSAT